MFDPGAGREAGARTGKGQFERLLVLRGLEIGFVLHSVNVTRTTELGESGVDRKPWDAGGSATRYMVI